MSLELKKLQEIELEMLKNFITICQKQKLRYFLLGGSVLGSVRHNGFIPWDDDIDVGMPREDYEKFLEIAKDYLPKHLSLQNIFTESDVYFNYSKIRNNNTTFVEDMSSHLKINHGVYLDVFPLDGFPNKRKQQKRINLLNFIYSCVITSYSQTKPSFKFGCLRKMLMLVLPNYKVALKKKDKLLRKYNLDSCEQIVNYCGAWGDKEIMPKEIFGNGVKGVFEGIEVVLPAKTDEYLTRLYGDYMKLPPVEKRVSHHYTTVVDFEKPYTEYTGVE